MASVYKRTWRGQDGRERVRWVAAYKDQHGRRQARRIGTARSSLRQYKNHVDLHILPLIGAVKLAKLSTPVVQLFRDKLLETRSRPLARKVLASLKSIIGEAMRRGLVAQNCAAPVTIDTKKREQGRLTIGVDIPSMSDVNTMIDHAQGRWRPFLITAALTGTRASELRGLVWDAVDFDKRVIHVRRRADLWGSIGKPKSAAGARVIPLAPLVFSTLREWKLACPKGKLGLVFPNGAGNVESHANLAARGFEPLQRACFGEVKYGLHSLRHFFASLGDRARLHPEAAAGAARSLLDPDDLRHLRPPLSEPGGRPREVRGRRAADQGGWRDVMPIIAVIDGIRIAIYYNDHPPPHFHAMQAEHEILVEIARVVVFAGSAPAAMERTVMDWASRYQSELALCWARA